MAKRICGILLSLIMLIVAVLPAGAAKSTSSEDPAHPKQNGTVNLQTGQNVLSAVASLTRVGTLEELHTALSQGCDGLYVEMDSVLRALRSDGVGASLRSLYAGRQGKPVAVRIYSRQAAVNLATWCLREKVDDLTVITSDYTVLRDLRATLSNVVGMMDYTSLSGEDLAREEFCADAAGTANAANASGVLLNASALTSELAEYFHLRFLCVWGQAETAGELPGVVTCGADGVVFGNAQQVRELLHQNLPKNTLNHTLILAAHRGVPQQAPENSLSGFQLAIQQGAQMLETDLQLTSDDEVVLMHDSTVDRTTTGSGKVRSMSLKQLKELHLWGVNDQFKKTHEKEKVPTLRELFELVRGNDVRLVLEIKNTEAVMPPLLAALIQEYGMEDRVNLISFDGTVVRRTRELLPTLSAARLFSLKGDTEGAIIAHARSVTLADLGAADAACDLLTRGVVLGLSARGIPLVTWTYAELNRNLPAMENAMFWGVQTATTNNPSYWSKLPARLSARTEAVKLKKKKSSATLNVTVYYYGGKQRTLSGGEEEYTVHFIYGNDTVKIQNHKIVALKSSGTASFFLSVESLTPTGQPYVLCSKPITVTVGTPATPVEPQTPQGEISPGEDVSSPDPVIFFSPDPFDAELALSSARASVGSLRTETTRRNLIVVIIAVAVILFCFAQIAIRSRREMSKKKENRIPPD